MGPCRERCSRPRTSSSLPNSTSGWTKPGGVLTGRSAARESADHPPVGAARTEFVSPSGSRHGCSPMSSYAGRERSLLDVAAYPGRSREVRRDWKACGYRCTTWLVVTVVVKLRRKPGSVAVRFRSRFRRRVGLCEWERRSRRGDVRARGRSAGGSRRWIPVGRRALGRARPRSMATGRHRASRRGSLCRGAALLGGGRAVAPLGYGGRAWGVAPSCWP